MQCFYERTVSLVGFPVVFRIIIIIMIIIIIIIIILLKILAHWNIVRVGPT